MDKKLSGLVASSSNPEEISNRVKGIILASSSLIIFASTQFFGIQLAAVDIVDLATQIGMIAGAVWTIYGSGLALINKFARV